MEYRGGRGLPAEYGVLGLLLDGPAHGYDVQQRMQTSLGPVWRVAWSQLYKVLHTLEERGWVAARTGDSPSGPPRTVYAITPDGRGAFFSWATTPVPRLRDLRVEFLAKLYFLRRHRPGAVQALLDRQDGALGRAADAWDARRGGDPWLETVSASFRRRQTESARAWIHEVKDSLVRERKDET